MNKKNIVIICLLTNSFLFGMKHQDEIESELTSAFLRKKKKRTMPKNHEHLETKKYLAKFEHAFKEADEKEKSKQTITDIKYIKKVHILDNDRTKKELAFNKIPINTIKKIENILDNNYNYLTLFLETYPKRIPAMLYTYEYIDKNKRFFEQIKKLIEKFSDDELKIARIFITIYDDNTLVENIIKNLKGITSKDSVLKRRIQIAVLFHEIILSRGYTLFHASTASFHKVLIDEKKGRIY